MRLHRALLDQIRGLSLEQGSALATQPPKNSRSVVGGAENIQQGGATRASIRRLLDAAALGILDLQCPASSGATRQIFSLGIGRIFACSGFCSGETRIIQESWKLEDFNQLCTDCRCRTNSSSWLLAFLQPACIQASKGVMVRRKGRLKRGSD